MGRLLNMTRLKLWLWRWSPWHLRRRLKCSMRTLEAARWAAKEQRALIEGAELVIDHYKEKAFCLATEVREREAVWEAERAQRQQEVAMLLIMLGGYIKALDELKERMV